MSTDEIVKSIYVAYGTDSGVLLGITDKQVVKAIVEFTINRIDGKEIQVLKERIIELEQQILNHIELD